MNLWIAKLGKSPVEKDLIKIMSDEFSNISNRDDQLFTDYRGKNYHFISFTVNPDYSSKEYIYLQ